jgi:peptide/nickel transport system permease protein
MVNNTVLGIAFTITTRLIVTLASILTLLFFLERMTGDPVTTMVGNQASAASIDAMREHMGLNRSLLVQYGSFVKQSINLDFGDSIRFQQPAMDLVLGRFTATLTLAFSAVTLAFVVGVPLGIYSAIFQRRFDGKLVNFLAGTMQSMPTFWLGLILLIIFSVHLNWFGSVANLEDNFFKRLALPAITLSSPYMARLIRLVRSSIVDEMKQPYVQTARSKGLTPWYIFSVHVFRNTLIPVIAFIGLDLSTMVGGSVIVENIFSYSGVGDQMITAIYNRDYPVVHATVFVISLLVFAINITSVYLSRIVDPRISA